MRRVVGDPVVLLGGLALLCALGSAAGPAPAVPLAARAADRPRLVAQVGHWDPAQAVAFSPDGNLVASGSKNGTIKLWDAATGAVLRTINGPMGIQSVAFGLGGRLLAS